MHPAKSKVKKQDVQNEALEFASLVTVYSLQATLNSNILGWGKKPK